MKFELIKIPSRQDPSGTDGVDMLQHPLSIGAGRLSSATNLAFENGAIKVRPGFDYQSLGIKGQVQGSHFYSPSKGLSAGVFASNHTALVVCVNGVLFLAETSYNQIECPAIPLCGNYDFCGRGEVNIFSAENWLVAQNLRSHTIFWNGEGCAKPSPGMSGCPQFEEHLCVELRPMDVDTKGPGTTEPPTSIPTSTSVGPGNGGSLADKKASIMKKYQDVCGDFSEGSHDTFCMDGRENYLINGAGLGIYAHGRVHQQNPFAVFVSDMVHKTGYKTTEDLILMEEQALPRYGDPLTWNSDLGEMVALHVLTSGDSSNGQGDLIAYFSNGVARYNTNQFPRDTRSSGKGETITEGWEKKRLYNRLVEDVSAVGRYAVRGVSNDQVFRSPHGLHFLSRLLGKKTFQTEQIDRISQDVDPILSSDDEDLLSGSACGWWVGGNRIFSSVGMRVDPKISASPMGVGFVSYNQATRFTEDLTNIARWEGLWITDASISGIHNFLNLKDRNTSNSLGFLCSKNGGEVLFAYINKSLKEDCHCGSFKPIEWSLETCQESPSNHQTLDTIKNGSLQVVVGTHTKAIRILIRSDKTNDWVEYGFEKINVDKTKRKTIPLGEPPSSLNDSSWFQIRIEGLGYCEIERLQLEASAGKTKSGDSEENEVSSNVLGLFETNESPAKERWENHLKSNR